VVETAVMADKRHAKLADAFLVFVRLAGLVDNGA
jgi:hypothetical protein